MEAVSTTILAAYGCTCEIKFRSGVHTTTNGEDWEDFPYPPTINNPVVTEFVKVSPYHPTIQQGADRIR